MIIAKVNTAKQKQNFAVLGVELLCIILQIKSRNESTENMFEVLEMKYMRQGKHGFLASPFENGNHSNGHGEFFPEIRCTIVNAFRDSKRMLTSKCKQSNKKPKTNTCLLTELRSSWFKKINLKRMCFQEVLFKLKSRVCKQGNNTK